MSQSVNDAWSPSLSKSVPCCPGLANRLRLAFEPRDVLASLVYVSLAFPACGQPCGEGSFGEALVSASNMQGNNKAQAAWFAPTAQANQGAALRPKVSCAASRVVWQHTIASELLGPLFRTSKAAESAA